MIKTTINIKPAKKVKRFVTESLLLQCIKDLDKAMDVLENIDSSGSDYKSLVERRKKFNRFPVVSM